MSSFQTRTRHASLIVKAKPVELHDWLNDRKTRSLSVPDLHKLKKEWDRYQQSDTQNSVSNTKLQVG